jgi:hypothetical protein
VTDVVPAQTGPGPDVTAADDTGSETFIRYRWQAKMAVLSWLECLAPGTSLVGVLCESVEDIVLVYSEKTVYAQLKTKTRGSWSDSNVCDEGGGVDSLVRTHNTISASPVPLEFHLWLEGPAGATKKTTAFFGDPSTASDVIRKKIVALGISRSLLPAFLARLHVRTDRPPRAHIDAVILQYIGATWPALNHPEREALFVRLLAHAEDAQAAALGGTHAAPLLEALEIGEDDEIRIAIAAKALTRELLISLTPTLPTTTRSELLARIASGEVASALELKMSAAGATGDTIAEAQELRARADARRLELLGGSETVRPHLQTLEVELLRMAEAHATAANFQGGSVPGVSAAPAEFVVAEIRRHPADLLAIDGRDLFERDTQLLFGLLCQLSDECRFWWRVE